MSIPIQRTINRYYGSGMVYDYQEPLLKAKYSIELIQLERRDKGRSFPIKIISKGILHVSDKDRSMSISDFRKLYHIHTEEGLIIPIHILSGDEQQRIYHVLRAEPIQYPKSI